MKTAMTWNLLLCSGLGLLLGCQGAKDVPASHLAQQLAGRTPVPSDPPANDPAAPVPTPQAPSNPARVEIISGQGQATGGSMPFPKPVGVRVLDQDNQPLSDIEIEWIIETGFESVVRPQSGLTDARGIFQTNLFAGTVPPGLTHAASAFRARVKGSGLSSNLFYTTTLYDRQTHGFAQMGYWIAQENYNLVVKRGEVAKGALKILFSYMSSPDIGVPGENFGLAVEVDRDGFMYPELLPTVECVGESGVTLSAADGVATCDLRAIGDVTGEAMLKVHMYGSAMIWRTFRVTVLE